MTMSFILIIFLFNYSPYFFITPRIYICIYIYIYVYIHIHIYIFLRGLMAMCLLF